LLDGLGESFALTPDRNPDDIFSHRRTKKKDIYVISTPQRPVPLEHYLYAGRDMFKIVDAKRNFLAQGYVALSLP
jgi:superfamily II RNA helicase